MVPTDIAAQTRFALAVAGGGAITVALAGGGLADDRKLDKRVMSRIVLSWFITLPLSTVFGALLYGVLG